MSYSASTSVQPNGAGTAYSALAAGGNSAPPAQLTASLSQVAGNVAQAYGAGNVTGEQARHLESQLRAVADGHGNPHAFAAGLQGLRSALLTNGLASISSNPAVLNDYNGARPGEAPLTIPTVARAAETAQAPTGGTVPGPEAGAAAPAATAGASTPAGDGTAPAATTNAPTTDPAAAGQQVINPLAGTKYGDAGTVNPGFPSGTPVPGNGAAPTDLATLDALPKDSDLGKYLVAADPQVDYGVSSAGEHGQRVRPNTSSSDNVSMSQLAAKDKVNAVSVNGGAQMLVYDAHGTTQLYDAKTGQNQSASLPTFASHAPPMGTLVLTDGTRVDMKAKDGTTVVSGNTITTYKPGGAASTVNDAQAVKTYQQSTAVNPMNVGVQQANGTFAVKNGFDADGKAQWVQASDGKTHLTDGANRNVAELQAALNGDAPVAGIVSNEQLYALNPGYADYVPPLPANDDSEKGVQDALAAATKAGGSDDNIGYPFMPMTQKEHDVILGSAIGGTLAGFALGPAVGFLDGVLGGVASRAVAGVVAQLPRGVATGVKLAGNVLGLTADDAGVAAGAYLRGIGRSMRGKSPEPSAGAAVPKPAGETPAPAAQVTPEPPAPASLPQPPPAARVDAETGPTPGPAAPEPEVTPSPAPASDAKVPTPTPPAVTPRTEPNAPAPAPAAGGETKTVVPAKSRAAEPTPAADAAPARSAEATPEAPAAAEVGAVVPDNLTTVAGKKLYPSGLPQAADIAQGGLGDCWLLSTMTTWARNTPERIMNAIKVNPDKTVTLRGMHNPDTGAALGDVVFDPALVARTMNRPLNKSEAMWPQLMELGVEHVLRGLQLRPPGSPSEMFTGATPARAEALFGNEVQTIKVAERTAEGTNRVYRDLTGANAGRNIQTGVATNFPLPKYMTDQGFVDGHAYAVAGTRSGANGREVGIINPHDGSKTTWVTIDEFKEMFKWYWV